MEGFVLELNKRDTARPAKAGSTAPVPERHSPPIDRSGQLDRTHRPGEQDEGVGTFRGLVYGVPIAIGLWVAIVGAAAYLIV